jgi:hypothetical protein
MTVQAGHTAASPAVAIHQTLSNGLPEPHLWRVRNHLWVFLSSVSCHVTPPSLKVLDSVTLQLRLQSPFIRLYQMVFLNRIFGAFVTISGFFSVQSPAMSPHPL